MKATVDKALIQQAIEALEIGDQFNPGLARVVLRAAPAEPAVELSITKHQANLVAHALAECINAAGICPYKESDFSVHELLLYAGDLKRKLVAVKRMLEAAVRLAQQN